MKRASGWIIPKWQETSTTWPDCSATLTGPAEAEPLYRRALAIDEKCFSPDHPNVATDLNNLALLLSNTNRLAEAEPLSWRHLRIFAKFGSRMGHEHPHFRKAINNYAGLLSEMGLSQDAIAARVRSAIEGEPKKSA
jgi:hypothetical protein